MPQIRLQALVSCPLFASANPQACRSIWGWAWEAQAGSLASALYKLGKAARGERRASFGGKHERRFGVLLALQFP